MRKLCEPCAITAVRLAASKTIIPLVFVLLYLAGALPASAWSNGYTYRRTITIDHTKVPNTDQSSFPVLVSGTYSYLATTGNGGNVTNTNGYDIIFTSDSSGASTLAFEQESYSASTGAVNYWVKVSSVSHTADTVIYMFYGNSSISTSQANATGTWDSNFKSVLHLTSASTPSDSTSNANSGTDHSATSASGKIGGGASFSSASSEYIEISGLIGSPASVTIEGWANKTSSSTTSQELVSMGDSATMRIDESGGTVSEGFYYNGTSWNATTVGSNYGSTGWHHFAYTVTSGSQAFYVDGASVGTSTVSGSPTFNQGTNTEIGKHGNGGTRYWDGQIDEIRISNSVRSADWIATEYHNQNSPSTFYTVGSADTGSNPTITSLSPTSGAVASSVTVTGTNFGSTQGSSTVTFNGTTATVTSWSSTSIATTVPTGATTGNVVVTVSSVASNGVSFTVTGSGSWSNGYTYRRTITIDHTKVPNTDQSSFPVLVSGTYSYLATTGNGGNVTNTNGYDIIFTSDSSGASTLAFEQESYSASTGAVNYWVKVSSVSHTADTVIYMFYGNSSISTSQANATGTWDSNFKSVLHLTSASTPSDSTSNANSGTDHSATSASGKIGGGASFSSASSEYIEISGLIGSPASVTIEGWANKTSSSTTSQELVSMGDSATMRIDESGGTVSEGFYYNGTSWNATTVGSNYGSTGWHHFAYTVTSGSQAFYVDGASVGTSTVSGSPTFNQGTNTEIGKHGNGGTRYWDGQIDEIRISNSVRSADWIATEYHNQNSPSTFYTVGSADTNGASSPSITSLSPTSGTVSTSVTVTGTNYGSTQGSSTVKFNGTTATPTSWSATSIVVPVPTGATTGNVVVNVGGVNSNGSSFTVNSSPTITSGNSASFSVGTSGSFTVTVTGVPAPTLSESGTLPSGISFNTSTGVLGGTAGSGTDGTYSVTFTAHNGVGTDATQSFTLTVGGSIYYYFSDAIGSSRVIATSTGTVCYDADFYPYGGERTPYTDTCDSAYKFTGKERDSESNLDDFGARYYSSQYGRFMTPDWAARPTAVPYAVFGDPQSLNLYGYVRNDPVTNADADGHQCTPGGEQCLNTKDDTKAKNTANGNLVGAQKQKDDQQYHQALKEREEKLNPTRTDADVAKALNKAGNMADAGVKTGLAVAGLEASAVVGTAVSVSATVLVASQTVGAAAETYIAPTASAAAATYVGGVSTVQDFVKGVTTTNPGSIPLTPGGAVGAAVRLVYDQVIKQMF